MVGTTSNWCKATKKIEMIKGFQIDMNGLETIVNLNILNFGSYDVMIGMD